MLLRLVVYVMLMVLFVIVCCGVGCVGDVCVFSCILGVGDVAVRLCHIGLWLVCCCCRWCIIWRCRWCCMWVCCWC